MLNRRIEILRKCAWIAADAGIVVAGAVLAYWIRFDFEVPEPYPAQIVRLLPVFVIVRVITLYYCGVYRGIGRYFGLNDVHGLVRATLIGSVLLVAADSFRNYSIAWGLSGAYVVSAVLYRLTHGWQHRVLSPRARRLVLGIIVAVAGGVLLAAVEIFQGAPMTRQSPIGQTAIGRWMLARDYLYAMGMPRSVMILELILSTGLLGFVHLAPRMAREVSLRLRRKNARRVLIIGAGDAGEMIAREMVRNPQSNYLPVGFIDDNASKRYARIHGLEVLGTRQDIARVVREAGVQEILIAIPSLTGRPLADLVRDCRATEVPIKTVPGIRDILGGGFRVDDLRAINTSAILGRDEVLLDVEEVAAFIQGRTVLVTGAGGSIGSELCRQVASYQPERIVLLGRGENSIFEILNELSSSETCRAELVPVIADVRDRTKLDHVFTTYRPDAVFHAAAHKHVHLMERAADEAVKNNVFGTMNTAEMAGKHGTSIFVMVSTDKAVNPTSVMGATKRVAEMVVQRIARDSVCKFVIVRFGNVIRSRGSVILLFEKQIAKGGPVTITHPDVTRYFMSIPEAVHLVLRSAGVAASGSICVLDMGLPVKIVDLARNLIRMAGLRPDEDIQIEYTGLKPGEKLSEEIHTADAKPTRAEGVFIDTGERQSASLTDENLELLRAAADASQVEEVRQLLRNIVPTYAPAPNVKTTAEPTEHA